MAASSIVRDRIWQSGARYLNSAVLSAGSSHVFETLSRDPDFGCLWWRYNRIVGRTAYKHLPAQELRLG